MFIDLYVPLVSCFEDPVHASPTEWNGETHSEAHSFLLALSQFLLIITLIVTRTTLAYTRGLAAKLQGQYVDTVQAHRDIESVKTVRLAELVDVTESSPRLAGSQQHRLNIPANTTTYYYIG